MATKTKTAPASVVTDSAQPVDALQLSQLKVEWVSRDTLRTNSYNPNRMTQLDRALLKQSILEDGWTQPIVTLLDGTIVDGEQRWTVAGFTLSSADVQAIIDKMRDREQQGFIVSQSILDRLQTARARVVALEADGHTPTLADMTGQLVPITRVDFKDEAHKMISTIRHNRARGTHQLDAMAEITQDLQQMGLDIDDLQVRLGMLPDEVERLMEIAPLQDIDADAPLSDSWVPVPIGAITTEQLLDNDQAELARARSAAAAQEAKVHALKVQEVEQRRKEETQARIQQEEAARGTALTQDEKRAVQATVAAALPAPEPMPTPQPLHKFVFFVTMEEFELCSQVLGEPPVQGFLTLCRAALAQQAA